MDVVFEQWRWTARVSISTIDGASVTTRVSGHGGGVGMFSFEARRYCERLCCCQVCPSCGAIGRGGDLLSEDGGNEAECCRNGN